jgi:LEA14-like dessication related protein
MRKLLVLVLFVLAGCASLLGLKPPEVALADVRLVEARLLEQRFRLTLRVSNPNDRDIRIDGLRFTMELAGQRFGQGVSGEQVVLKRLSETSVPVEVSAQLLNLLGKLKGGDEGLDYRLQGEVITHDYGTLPFTRTGKFRLLAQ